MMRAGLFMILALLLLAVAPCVGQIVNGAFEDPGATARPWKFKVWNMPCVADEPAATLGGHPTLLPVPLAWKNRAGHLGDLPGTTEPGCMLSWIYQWFCCGPPANPGGQVCAVAFDAKFAPGAGELAYVELETPLGSVWYAIPPSADYQHWTITAPGCGWPTKIAFYLSGAVSGVNGRLFIDNVAAQCGPAGISGNLQPLPQPPSFQPIPASALDTRPANPWLPKDEDPGTYEDPRCKLTYNRISWGPIPVERLTGNAGCLGVQELHGEYYVSARDPLLGTAHVVYVFDQSGHYTRSFPAVGVSTSAWGYRDGATDGTSLMWGAEGAIHVIDTTGAPASSIVTSSSPGGVPITSPIPVTAVSTVHALEYDPDGNGGGGSFWVGSFASDLFELDLSGAVITIVTNPGTWSFYGLAWDSLSGMLWVNSVPTNGDIALIDPVAGVEAGPVIKRSQRTASQGGLCGVVGGAGTSGNAFDLVGLDQGTPDAITGYRVNEPSGLDGTTEPRLVARVTSACQPGGNLGCWSPKSCRLGDSLHWGYYVPAGSLLSNEPGLLMLTVVGQDSSLDTQTPYFGLIPTEFVAPNFRANCPGTAPLVVGDGFMSGTLFGYPALIGPHFLNDPAVGPIPLPPWAIPGDVIRLQALYWNPAYVSSGGTPVLATNEVRFIVRDSYSILVAAKGPDSWNADTTRGFWRIIHRGGLPPIQWVELDFSTSPNLDHLNARFDTDQSNMADAFWNGDSTLLGCQGTYRNGSDVACGLRYDATNTYKPANPGGCDPNAYCGFQGTNPIGSSHNYQTLKFRFTAGQFQCDTFEFDADTDLTGASSSGSAMNGLRVTVTLFGGTVLCGNLMGDADDPCRSYIQF